MHSLDLEFGVGSATSVEEIRILWPSGWTQILEDLDVNQVISVTEPES
jgi:hypothetical protein